MRALLTEVGREGSTGVVEIPDARSSRGEVLLRPLRIGVCGTDREIVEGRFGVAPDGETTLILGHEVLARVQQSGHGFEAGELVCASVRRSCGHCPACDHNSPDSCLTGEYFERGITRLNGFAAELVAESPGYLISVPSGLGEVAVLGEPTSICARAIRHAKAIGDRQPWSHRRALVLGTGAIGMLATYSLRLEGWDVSTGGLAKEGDERAELVDACGATYFCVSDMPASRAAREIGGFDLVIEATGNAQVMIDSLGLLARNGVACLMGIDGRPRNVSIDGRIIGVDTIIQNRALFGTVNAHRQDWLRALESLVEMRRRWPSAIESFVGLRVPLDRFGEALSFTGVKAVLTVD